MDIIVQLILYLLSIPVFMFIIFCLYITYIRHIKYGKIPRPKYSSLFGHVTQLVADENNKGIYRGDTFTKWQQELGPVYCCFMLHTVLLIVTDPEAAEIIIAKYPRAVIYKKIGYFLGERSLGEGLLTEVDHDVWFRRRKIYNANFQKKVLVESMDVFKERSDVFVNELMPVADGKTTVSMMNMFNRLTLDAIGKIAFGMDVDSLKNHDNTFSKAIKDALTGYDKMMQDPLFLLNPANWAEVREKRASIRLIRETGKKCYEQRKKEIEEGKNVPNDILTGMLKNSDQGVSFEVIMDDFFTFFIGGQETTAGALSFLLIELDKYPECIESIYNEIDSVIGQKKDITYEDLTNLPYLNMVWKEILRLHPVVPGTSRTITEDTKVCGYDIPAGTHTAVYWYAMQHNPEYFQEPQKFMPERFADGTKYPFIYMPFSVGTRSCIGQNFATIEAKILLAKFFQNFNYRVVPGQLSGTQEALTARPRSNVDCFISKRFQ